MMGWGKARKKPIVIDYREPEPNVKAVVFKDGSVVGETPLDWPDVKGTYYKRVKVEKIETREGTIYAFPGVDYVLRGSEGEIYPIKREIFAKTFEVVEEAS